MNELPSKWQRKNILIVVKTYPTPSKNYEETVCTAGITEDGRWIRLYPIRFRFLEDEKKYRKYQWLNVEITKRDKDYRPDSFTPNLDTVVNGMVIGTENDWAARKAFLLPTAKASLEEIIYIYENTHYSLGMFKPEIVDDIIFEEVTTAEKETNQQQMSLFTSQSPLPLEPLDYKFYYIFKCNDPKCKGHRLSIIDWEAGQLYRRLKRGYEIKQIMEKFKAKWLETMFSSDRDSYLIVGNKFLTPSFMVLGVFWPPKSKQTTLF